MLSYENGTLVSKSNNFPNGGSYNTIHVDDSNILQEIKSFSY